MNDQTRKNRVNEARKKRREYVIRVIGARTSAGAALCVAVISGLATLAGLFDIFYCTCFWDFGLSCVAVAVTTFFAAGIYLACLSCQHYMDKAAATPYVPPVREQIANLPADEVLLRGSEEPAAVPEELLRASQAETNEAKLTSL